MWPIRTVGCCLLAVLLICAFNVAQSYAGEPNWKVNGKFMDLNEERANATISGKLKFGGLQLGGQEVEFECDTDITEKLIGGGVDTKGVDHPGTDEATAIVLKNCIVLKPAKCTMTAPLTREPGGKNFFATKLVAKPPKIFHEIANLEFIRIELKNNGAEACPLSGKTFRSNPSAYLYDMANLTGKIKLALRANLTVTAESESESSDGEIEGSEEMEGPEGQPVEVREEDEDEIETVGAVIGELEPVDAKASSKSTVIFDAFGSTQEFEILNGTEHFDLQTEIDGLGGGTFPFKSVEVATETLKGPSLEIKGGERGTCKAAKKGAGEYLNATCTEPGAKGGPKKEFAWLPRAKAAAFTSSSGEATLRSFTPEGAEVPAVTCTRSKGKGKLLTATTSESTITFEGCASGGEKCTGGAKAKAGQIETYTLDGRLGMIAGGSGVGEAVSGGGPEGAIAQFGC
jgi:hypothetical protein